MRMLLVGVLLVAGASLGCDATVKVSSQPAGPPASVKVSTLTDAQKIDLLRQEAHKRGLAWKVICTRFYEDDPEGFLGVAWPANKSDDSENDRWMKDALTQPDAALALYEAIQGSPTHPAQPKEVIAQRRKPYMCPLPELRGN